jgi:hypothetical protein
VTVPTDSVLSALAREVRMRLLERRRRLATVESCTGGWIAKFCTDIAGSSDWFECGFVGYSNAAKVRDLGVPARVIESDGAVSEPVVRAKAEGALATSSSKRLGTLGWRRDTPAPFVLAASVRGTPLPKCGRDEPLLRLILPMPAGTLGLKGQRQRSQRRAFKVAATPPYSPRNIQGFRPAPVPFGQPTSTAISLPRRLRENRCHDGSPGSRQRPVQVFTLLPTERLVTAKRGYHSQAWAVSHVGVKCFPAARLEPIVLPDRPWSIGDARADLRIYAD